MNKVYILKKNHEIEQLIRYKHSVGNRFFSIYYKKDVDTKIVVSVSKKIGKAVERNYQKRIVKEILRKNISQIKNMHILISVKILSLELNYEEKSREVCKLIRKIKGDKDEFN